MFIAKIVKQKTVNCQQKNEESNQKPNYEIKMVEVKNPAIPFHPELVSPCGSVTAAILMQQLCFRFNVAENGFVKSKNTNEEGMVGWLDELQFTRAEFDGAYKLIATHYKSATDFYKIQNAGGDVFQGKPFCSFYNHGDRLIYHFQDQEMVKQIRKEALEEYAFEKSHRKKQVTRVTSIARIRQKRIEKMIEKSAERMPVSSNRGVADCGNSALLNNKDIKKEYKKNKGEDNFQEQNAEKSKEQGGGIGINYEQEINLEDQQVVNDREAVKENNSAPPVLPKKSTSIEPVAECEFERRAKLALKGFRKQRGDMPGIVRLKEECCLLEVDFDLFKSFYEDYLMTTSYWKDQGRRPNPFELLRSLNSAWDRNQEVTLNRLQEFKVYYQKQQQDKVRAALALDELKRQQQEQKPVASWKDDPRYAGMTPAQVAAYNFAQAKQRQAEKQLGQNPRTRPMQTNKSIFSRIGG